MKTGDKIKTVTFPSDSVDGASSMTETPNQTLHYEEQNLGEYGIGWVVLVRDGIEANRTNVKYVETIVWK